jgi:hypothetical protein
MKNLNLPLVIVTWVDSGYADSSWIEAKSRINKPMPTAYSVGWLYHKSKEKVILFSAWCSLDGKYQDGDEGSLQEIATKNIKDIKELSWQ